MESVVRELERNGFRVTDRREEFPAVEFKDIGSVVYYLKAIPWQVADFSPEKYRNRLLRIHDIIMEQGKLETVKLLISKGANTKVKQDGLKLIHIAAQNGHKEMVEYLLTQGFSVDERANDWSTPLHHSILAPTTAVAEFLISRGADVNAMNTNDLTALKQARHINKKEFIELLLKAGAKD